MGWWGVVRVVEVLYVVRMLVVKKNVLEQHRARAGVKACSCLSSDKARTITDQIGKDYHNAHRHVRMTS